MTIYRFFFAKWQPSDISDSSDAVGPLMKSTGTWWSLSVCRNLVGINALVSITRKFDILHIWFENAYSRPKIGVWGFYPINGQYYQRHHQEAHPSSETHHTTYSSLRFVDLFCTAHPFTQLPKIMCYTMLFKWPHTPKVPLPAGHRRLT